MNLFSAPFPWNQGEWQQFVGKFKIEDSISVKWWWEPFHKTGFNALEFCQKYGIQNETLEKLLTDLSCPAGGNDPELSIRKSAEESSENRIFDKNLSCLPTIRDLKKAVGGSLEGWIPLTMNLPEFFTVSNWLTANPSLMSTFYKLDEWNQLELIELLCGQVVSSSILNFQRVYISS